MAHFLKPQQKTWIWGESGSKYPEYTGPKWNSQLPKSEADSGSMFQKRAMQQCKPGGHLQNPLTWLSQVTFENGIFLNDSYF